MLPVWWRHGHVICVVGGDWHLCPAVASGPSLATLITNNKQGRAAAMFGISRALQRADEPRHHVLPSAGWMRRDEAIMGTAISVELWSDDALGGSSAIDAVMQEMHRIDRTMSPHKADSELSRINR